MPVVRPDNRVRVVVYDDRDVAVAFPIAGFVDADVDEPAVAHLRVRLQQAPDAPDEPPHGLEVDLQPFGYALAAEPALEHPRCGKREVGREARFRASPRNPRGQDAVRRAVDARQHCTDADGHGAEVHAAPEALRRGVVVDAVPPAADRASPLLALDEMDVDGHRRVVFEVDAVDFCPLDVEQPQ